MTFRAAQWDNLDDIFYILVCKRKTFLSVLMASVISLHFSVQEEDIFECTNGKCQLCTL